MDLTKLTELANALPETYKANALALITEMGQVIEGIGDTPISWRPPLLRVVQGTTDRTKLPKGTAIGDIMIGEAKVTETPIAVIPIRTWKARQMWSPDQNEAKMLCSSPDAKAGYLGYECASCPHSVYNEETRKSDCNKIVSALAITADLRTLFSTNFAKTSYMTGVNWEKTMKNAGVLMYKRAYGLKSSTNTQFKNIESLEVTTLSDKERNVPEELLPFLAELFSLVSEDRKESIDRFYKYLATKPKPDAALLTTSADSEVVAVTSDVPAKPEAQKYVV